MSWTKDSLIQAAREAAATAYAPYSGFHVGAALGFADGFGFADGLVITGANAENASYGLTLCAETVAVSIALSVGIRGGLEAVAVIGGKAGQLGLGAPVSPCGRCRQMLSELAQLGGTDPVVWCVGEHEVLELPLSALLPHAFGPDALA